MNLAPIATGATHTVFPAVAGALVVALILWETFETVVLPRRVARRFRFTVLVYRSMWLPWKAVARAFRGKKARETFLSFFGPLSLLILFAVWAGVIVCGFALMYYSNSSLDSTHPRFETCLYFSGTTMFTLGIGDVVPHTTFERVLVVLEGGLGLGFLALILSYLPVIYQAFSRREVNIVLLDARAGSPPTGAEMLRRHSGPAYGPELERILRDWERASADILESHVSYPAVSYFRSQHTNESWLAALTAILDTCSLLLACTDHCAVRQAKLTFAMGRHAVVDLSQLFGEVPRRGAPDRLPPAEFERLRGSLTKAGFQIRDDESSREKLAKLRGMYEPFLLALSRYLFMDIPPWILAKEITDNWKTSAWGRISGLAGDSQVFDDHSD
jgi:Ion channel